MKLLLTVLLSLSTVPETLPAQSGAAQAREMLRRGEALSARSMLQSEAQNGDAGSVAAYAEYLDLHKDPETRAVYQRLLTALPANPQRTAVLRRLVVLDLLAGDQPAAAKHVAEYHAAGGAALALPAPASTAPLTPGAAAISIPGPIRSFARMAALSPDLKPEELLPALARNVVTNGYQASSGGESLEPTEFMKLIIRYLAQARELEKLAGAELMLKVPSCESSATADLLRVIGYRMRGGCGSDVVLETINATRAFLTIDSGFPLAELEQALRANRPFEYDFHPTQAPVLFGADYWRSSREKQGQEFIDTFLGDPSLCRLYLGMTKLDPDTADQLRKAISVQKSKSFAHVLDFFGGMFQIRNGRAVAPGGARSEKAWADLVGVSPEHGAQFFERLIVKEDGWLASYFDALTRVRGPVQEYLTDPARMRRYYNAIKGKVTSPGPARPVFRSNTDMMLLTTRLRVGADGKVLIPGNLEIWKSLFVQHPHGKYDGKLTKAATGWKDPDDLIEALFGLSRKAVENEPLKIFMALSDLDRRRATPLKPATVDRLARNYKLFGSQFAILNEAPTLRDETINQYLDTAQAVLQIRDQGLRADVAGTMQALVSLWQIFCRQESIPKADADATLAGLIAPFGKLKNGKDLFDAGYIGTKQLLQAAGAKPGASPQDALTDLLAGAQTSLDVDSHTQLVQNMMRIFEAQNLVSLKVLFDIAEHIDSLTHGGKLDTALLQKLASRIAEVQLPRSSLSGAEKNSFAFGYWAERHVESQRKLNLRASIEKAGNDPEKLKDLRGLLAPIMRDTLVGMNYAHYAPPGAQILQTNPLFVRGHDFLGIQGTNQTWKQTEVFGSGWPSSAGGRLVGSLAGLPYALAEAEQNFLIPRREQALIWGDLVPQMILMAKVPRWWRVTPAQTYWVGLHMRLAESALAEAALDTKVRSTVMNALGEYAPPARVSKVARLLDQGLLPDALEFVMPSEQYLLSRDLLAAGWSGSGPFAGEIQHLSKSVPDEVGTEAISRAFGTPKPTLANSYQPELLNLRTFPTLMGYSSRIMAESWESNLLYFAALSDEVHAPPSQLNVLVPEWTQKTVEQIFATHLEDWPALLRSLHVVGNEVRAQSKKMIAANQAALPQ